MWICEDTRVRYGMRLRAAAVPKATSVFDADDSRFGAKLARINGKMPALQSRIAKFAVAFDRKPLKETGGFQGPCEKVERGFYLSSASTLIRKDPGWLLFSTLPFGERGRIDLERSG